MPDKHRDRMETSPLRPPHRNRTRAKLLQLLREEAGNHREFGQCDAEPCDWCLKVRGVLALSVDEKLEKAQSDFFSRAAPVSPDEIYVNESPSRESLQLAASIPQSAHDLRTCPAMRALERLTPGGSEYVDDIPRCVEHVREARRSMMDAMVKIKKQAAPVSTLHKSYNLSASGSTAGHWVCQCGADLGDCPIDEIDDVFAAHKAPVSTPQPDPEAPLKPNPTYYVAHPDGSFSVAAPQPCTCHSCTQARYRTSDQFQIDSALRAVSPSPTPDPPLTDSMLEEIAYCGKWRGGNPHKNFFQPRSSFMPSCSACIAGMQIAKAVRARAGVSTRATPPDSFLLHALECMDRGCKRCNDYLAKLREIEVGRESSEARSGSK